MVSQLCCQLMPYSYFVIPALPLALGLGLCSSIELYFVLILQRSHENFEIHLRSNLAHHYVVSMSSVDTEFSP
jgi:hypothetical protein